jgi:predicted ABC-type transport system involved in lysophospholipase L1 biosynthesis ATPase subunit
MGARLADLDSEELARWRAANVGLVFQDPHLIPGLTALENVMLARVPHERDRGLADRARDMLGAVGLADRIDFPPSRLSGGERQRVGIARALVGRPSLLLADEPTGNLDAASTASILDLLGRLRADLDLTMLVATHDPIVSQHSDRDHRLRDG